MRWILFAKNTEIASRVSFFCWIVMISFIIASATGCKSEKSVVVYTSVDQPFAEPVFREFTARTGILVRPVFDTEAAKTVGLVNRLRAESSAPMADVYWSSEFAHTIRLAEEGLFSVYSPASSTDISQQFKDQNSLWTGFGLRARVLLINTTKIGSGSTPYSIQDLLDESWAPGQVAIARPLFGTANTHAAAIFAEGGESGLNSLFSRLNEKKAAFVDGNSVVRDRVSAGTSLIGLTDTDDAVVAIKRGDPVRMIFPDQGENGSGTMVIPNTAALLKNCPNAENGKRFLDFLTSPEGEKTLIKSGEGFFPVRQNMNPGLEWLPKRELRVLSVSFQAVADAIPSATAILKEQFLK